MEEDKKIERGGLQLTSFSEVEDEDFVAETTKEKIKRMYDELAKKNGFNNIEDFYVHTKMALAMSDLGDRASDNKIKLLKSIASDLGIGGASKEYVVKNSLPTLSKSDILSG